MALRFPAALLFFVVSTAGHAQLEYPRPRTPPKGIPPDGCVSAEGDNLPPWTAQCLWHQTPGHFMYSQGCIPGCGRCTGKSGDGISWGCTPKPAAITDPAQRTFLNKTVKYHFRGVALSSYPGSDPFPINPWRNPGLAPVIDPCGVHGGNNDGGVESGNGGPPPLNTGGQHGSSLPESPDKVTWKVGETVEAMWNLFANHGGGYQYRLCKKGILPLTEACFQRTPLEFVGQTQWIQYGSDPSKRTEIPATRITEGVHPAGSTWTKNPIPPCDGDQGGAGGSPCVNPAWAPPLDELWGYGTANCFTAVMVPTHGGTNQTSLNTCLIPLPEYPGFGSPEIWQKVSRHFDFHVVDKLKIPDNLHTGEYALSWRWDSEQTPQVWQNCADITIA